MTYVGIACVIFTGLLIIACLVSAGDTKKPAPEKQSECCGKGCHTESCDTTKED